MKKLLLYLFLILLFNPSLWAQPTETPRSCATADDFYERLETEEGFRERIQAIETLTAQPLT